MKGNGDTPSDPWPALLLALGYTVSATVFFALVWALGGGLLGQWRSHPAVGLTAALALVGLILADAGAFGWRTPMWRRQTPKWFVYRFGNRRSALMWGLDAGLVVTTFRITSLSWAALTLAFAGLVPWWAGLVFALGFVLPELTSDLLVPRRTDPTGRTDPEPGWLTDRIEHLRPAIRPVGFGLLGLAAAWATVSAAIVG